MKTKILNPIAIVALSVLTLSINAQNTKSVEFNRHSSDQLLASVENHNIISAVSEELNSQLTKLAEFSKFFPRVNVTYFAEPNYSETFAAVSSELEKEAKFRPEESLVNKMDEMVALGEITKELEKDARFNPSESMVDSNDNISAELTEIVAELAKEVKYKPNYIQ